MVDSKLLSKHGFKEEVAELLDQDFSKTGFPESIKRYNLVYEASKVGMEEPYFWVLDILKGSYPNIIKVEDTFSASENSSFFGMTQQRLGLQQDKVSQYLAQVGRMVKELFQIVRELRILDERLTLYNGAEKELDKEQRYRHKGDEVTLKGSFIDLVQGGGKSPASVYGLATQLEYVTLPDLFFDAPPFKNKEEMEKHVEGLKENFNDAVLRVLLRQLNNFLVWRQSTHKEHKNRKNFQLKYLKQHYDVIQMYMTWIKPYLRTVRKLSLKSAHQDSAELISSFEGSMMDVEIIAHDPSKTHCILATFNYRTKPELVFHNEYQKGGAHVGKMDMQIRVMDWSLDDIKRYKKMKEEEDLLLIGDVSASVQTSMAALGDELAHFLKEAEGKLDNQKDKSANKKKQKKSLIRSLFGDFMEPRSEELVEVVKETKRQGNGKMQGLVVAWAVYNNFKKAHRMITW